MTYILQLSLLDDNQENRTQHPEDTMPSLLSERSVLEIYGDHVVEELNRINYDLSSTSTYLDECAILVLKELCELYNGNNMNNTNNTTNTNNTNSASRDQQFEPNEPIEPNEPENFRFTELDTDPQLSPSPVVDSLPAEFEQSSSSLSSTLSSLPSLFTPLTPLTPRSITIPFEFWYTPEPGFALPFLWMQVRHPNFNSISAALNPTNTINTINTINTTNTTTTRTLLNRTQLFDLLGPYKKVKKNDYDLIESSCSICHSNFQLHKSYRKLRCNHVFHKPCIDRWIRGHHLTCPNCRLEIK